MRLLSKEITDGGRQPAYYGLAWFDYDRKVAVLYPIPLNAIMAWARRFYIWLRQNNTYSSGYDKGYGDGEMRGRAYGTRLAYSQTLRKEIRQILENYQAEYIQIMKLSREDKKINGWGHRFIERELKRLDANL